jgi:sigma-B regulation protein RsbU (phosphoserine phosphatase)
MNTVRTKKVLIYLALAAVFLFTLSGSFSRFLDGYELKSLDFRFLVRPAIHTTDKVAMIEIGDDSIEKLGRFPFDRSYHALMVKALSEAGARAIIFDIFFSEEAEHDDELEGSISKAGNVYLPYVFNLRVDSSFGAPEAFGYVAKDLDRFIIVSKATGHINIIPDTDGKFRRIPLYVKYEGVPYPYVSFLASLDYLGVKGDASDVVPGKYLKCGSGINIPLDDRSDMIINYAGKWGSSYRHYSYVDVLQSYLTGEPRMDLSIFRDKLCVIGLTAAGTVDLHPNSFESLYPGMGIHAEIFNSLISRNFVSRMSREANAAILAILILVVSFMTLSTKPARMLFRLIGVIAIFVLGAIILFNISGIWIDMIYPVFTVSLVYIGLTLYRYVGEWKKRLLFENELSIAKRIQESFLPEKLPECAGLEISAVMFTAKQVGGDLYDFVEFSPDRLGIMIGDVSGKGIPASLFMSLVSGEFKFFAKQDSLPEKALLDLNQTLLKKSSSKLYVTMFFSIFDMKARTMAYSNGGHLPVIWARPGKEAKFLDVEDGTPLGMTESGYSGGSVGFEKGDVFLFYTDGITEAMNMEEAMYGEERLVAMVNAKIGLASKDILAEISKDVRKFEPKAGQHDDMTLLVVKIV